MFNFLKSVPVRVATAILLLQGGLLYSSIRPEFIPTAAPLAGLPRTLGPWQFLQEGVIDAETMAILQADDTVIRTYKKGNSQLDLANIYVASFRSQRTGKAPHSPKNCLPGSGWLPLDDREVTLTLDGRSLPVNRYVIAHGDERSLVYYWYQSRGRAVAGEFKAKFWVLADAIRLNRTDTALVRVIVPIFNRNEEDAEAKATDFIRSFYPTLLGLLPA